MNFTDIDIQMGCVSVCRYHLQQAILLPPPKMSVKKNMPTDYLIESLDLKRKLSNFQPALCMGGL